MQTSKDFTEEIMNFPAAGFAVASFVNPDIPQPATTTNPIFTPDPSSPTPSAVENNSFEDNNFPIPLITPSPTEMPKQDFSSDNLLGIGTKDMYFPKLGLSDTPSDTPSPTVEPFVNVIKKDNSELICFKICTLIFALIIGCIVTYLLFFNNKSPPVEKTSGFGSTFDTIIDDLILNN